MARRITFFILPILLFLAGNARAAVKTNAVLAWDYPTNELSTNLTFKIHSHTNAAVPATNWPVIVSVAGTNLSVTLPIQPGLRFFSVTASNEWGESDFSNVAVALVPRRGDNFRIRPE